MELDYLGLILIVQNREYIKKQILSLSYYLDNDQKIKCGNEDQ